MKIEFNGCKIESNRTRWEHIWSVTNKQGVTAKYKALSSRGTFGHGVKAYAHMDRIAPGWRELEFSSAA